MEYYLPNNYTENKTVVVSDWNYQNENVTYDTLQTKFDTLIGGAPELLDDLNSLRELADGINNDPLFYSKVVTTSTTQTISGTKTFSDPVIFNGNVTVGNSTADVLTVTSGATLINLKTTGNTVLGDVGGSDLTDINGNISFTPLSGTRLSINGETRINGAIYGTYHGTLSPPIGNGSLINWNCDGFGGITSFVSGGHGNLRGFEFLQYGINGDYLNMGLKIKNDGNAIMNDVAFSNITVSGTTSINGEVTLGDASSDTLTVNSSCNLKNNITLGDADTDVLTINATSTSYSPANFNHELRTKNWVTHYMTNDLTKYVFFNNGDCSWGGYNGGTIWSINISGNASFNDLLIKNNSTFGDDSLVDTMTVNAISSFNGVANFNNTINLNGTINANGSTFNMGNAVSDQLVVTSNTVVEIILGSYWQ